MSEDSPITQLAAAMNQLFSYLHTKSREEKFRLFIKLLKPTPSMRILNVGASGPHCAFAEQFESLYEHPNQLPAAAFLGPKCRITDTVFPA
jgi:hypothetical protein